MEYKPQVALLQPPVMPTATAIKEKVKELVEVLKAEGLWMYQEPNWVTQYCNGDDSTKNNFFEWLQFVYLPNLMTYETNFSYPTRPSHLAPQAVRFLEPQTEHIKLLQLLVELDALT